jgi:hypothetical protein
VRVTLYDAKDWQLEGRSLEGVLSVEVEVQPEWWVADVLEAGGHMPYSLFALVTPEIEVDLSYGEHRMINAPDLFGIDDQGAIKFQGQDHITWVEFLRAHQAGLYEGDPTRIVVYYGAAGGLSPDGLWEAVQWLFENRDVAVDALGEVAKAGGAAAAVIAGAAWVNGKRLQWIARQWRAQGFTATRIRDLLGRCPQWDPSLFAKQRRITEPEARLALTNAGYEEGQGGLWRPADTEEGRRRRKGLEEIERRAYAEMEDEWVGRLASREDEPDDDQ